MILLSSLATRILKIIVEKRYLNLEDLRKEAKGQELMKVLNKLEERGFIRVGKERVRVTYSGLLASEKWKPKGKRITLIICKKELKGFRRLFDNIWITHGTVRNINEAIKMYGLSLKEVSISRNKACKIDLIKELHRIENLARKTRTEKGLSYATVKLLKLIRELSKNTSNAKELRKLHHRVRKIVYNPNKSRLITEIANLKKYIKIIASALSGIVSTTIIYHLLELLLMRFRPMETTISLLIIPLFLIHSLITYILLVRTKVITKREIDILQRGFSKNKLAKKLIDFAKKIGGI